MEHAVVPVHLGLILDGNRRWARENGLPQLEGHRRGYENLKTIAEYAIDRGVKFVSAYVFSTENWKRSAEEVKYLMDLLYMVATKEAKEVHEKGIRIRFLGSRQRLSRKIVKAIEKAEQLTAGNTRGTIALCLNYGGRQEIADAVSGLIADGVSAEDVTPESIQERLYDADIPDVDLLVRTSGEQRLSNFMLWRVAYAELLFVPQHWPAFTKNDLDLAIAEFSRRSRRFGGDAVEVAR